MNKLYFYSKVIYLLLARRLVSSHIVREDYDRLSVSYDHYFAEHMAKHARRLVTQLGLRPGNRVLDLATGTGNLALALAEAVSRQGEVIGVDQSAGMLAKAEEKRIQAGYRHLRFVQGDMHNSLLSYPDNSFDVITCGWAIGYGNPSLLVKTMHRKLKPGGKLGLIENARDTLAPIHMASLKVAQTMPRHLQQIMDLHRHLPKHKLQLQDWFESANLRTMSLWEGREEFSFASGADVLNWVLHTGASAGFDRMMAPELKTRCDELFIKYIEASVPQNSRIIVEHHYVAGIAQKETLPCT
jgi:ubiquinone/menaquinone biosynthesis C-methylase UbiE